ncbi:MAG: DUF3021 domain-containing protein [Clostridium sp.]|nr:DUF3021 domain-containing protein [Clostridium sp.]
MKRMKLTVMKALQGFSYAVTINVLIGVVIMLVSKEAQVVPVVPDFADKFPSPMAAFGVQCLLIGLTSAAFAAGSRIMEIASWSLVKQSIVYFVVTAAVWIPVSVLCWGLGKYPATFFGVTGSYLIGYIISWTVQYRICKRNIEEINEKLKELNRS